MCISNTGLRTHNMCHMTHLVTGLVAKDTSFALSIKCHYNLLPGHRSHDRTGIFTKCHDSITAGSFIWNKQFYPSHQCHLNIVLPMVCSPSGGIKINQHSGPTVVCIYVLPNKLHSNSCFDKKVHKCYKISLLPLLLAMNHMIYLF